MRTNHIIATRAATDVLVDAQLVVHLAAARAINSGRTAEHLIALESRLGRLGAWLVDATKAGTVLDVDVTEPTAVAVAS